jgi:hypothetical protein
MKCVACMMCHYTIESAGFRNLPRSCGANGPLRKSERPGPTVNPPSPALSTARDQKPIAIQTAVSDCGPQPGQTSPILGWSVIAVKPSRRRGSAEWRHGWSSDENTSKSLSKLHFLRSRQKFKKFGRCFSRIGIS